AQICTKLTSNHGQGIPIIDFWTTFQSFKYEAPRSLTRKRSGLRIDDCLASFNKRGHIIVLPLDHGMIPGQFKGTFWLTGCFEHFPSTYSRFVCPAEYKSVFHDLVRTQIIYGRHKLGSSGINFLHIGYTESGIGSWSDVVVFVTGK